jgi:xanthine dehydrogenase YagR molybdenum-binding subunit
MTPRNLEAQWKPRDEMKLLNSDLRRVDGGAKVSGRAKYTHDIRLPGMLYARLLLCHRPAAAVEKIDVAPALAVPGVVHAVVFESSGTRFLGQPVAVVAAETIEAAGDGIRAIDVVYEDAGWAITPEQATADGAPEVAPRGNSRMGGAQGDAAETQAALERADVVIEATYTVPVQHHACLETHGIVVDFDGEKARVWASSQTVFGVRGEVAGELGISADDVEVIVEYMGGGFGSKFSIGIEGRAACRVAADLKRPVHLMVTRQDEFLMAGNRSGGKQTLKGGVTLAGELVALDAEVWRYGGLQGGSNPGQPYIYGVATSHLRMGSVFTNMDGNRAMRAPGHPQASFAIESLIDELAYAIGMDLVDIRLRNLSQPTYHRQLKRCAQEIGWNDHPYRTHPGAANGGVQQGIGFGVSTWGGGGRRQCVVTVRIEPDGSVSSSVGTQDLGTGSRTYVGAIVAEELGLPEGHVLARIGHSDYGNANGSGGSVTTGSLAPAVQDAAYKARMAFAERLAEWLACRPGEVVFADGAVFSGADPGSRLTWLEACSILGSDPVVAVGEWQEHLQASGIHGAQAATVEVDTTTGALRVLKMVCVQDCGLPLNRKATRSQINGGMIEALGYALYEERVVDPWLGAALSANFDDYKLPNSAMMPEIVSIIDDGDQRQQVIGMAEATIIPGHSAIANAVHNACGVRVRDLPLTPDKILAGLLEQA